MIQLASFYRASWAAAKAGALALPSLTRNPINPKGLGFAEMMSLDDAAFAAVSRAIEK